MVVAAGVCGCCDDGCCCDGGGCSVGGGGGSDGLGGGRLWASLEWNDGTGEEAIGRGATTVARAGR